MSKAQALIEALTDDTNAKVAKAKAEFEKHAKEELNVEDIGGTLYAFGSELATLRLFKAYAGSGERAKQGYSKNVNSFFFRLEPNV
jgi:hypothetical protein